MNTKKIFKKLTAVATGATMIGATMMGALAADLSNFPDNMVSDGTFDGFLVVGESASSVDNLAMTDIAASMWYTSEGETSSTTVEGDAWLAETSSNFLELGEAITSIESELDSEHLSALADGEITNSKGTADYEQSLTIGPSDVDFEEDDDENLGWSYLIADGISIATYELDFQTELESDVDSNGDWEDIEDEEITMLGKTYTIVSTDNNTIQIVLMGGAASDTLSEGESATYDVVGTEYDVEVLSVTSNEVQFSINGETTNKLEDGETDVLSDGTNIGLTSITYQDYAGGIHSATFFIGANKLDLKNGSPLKVNEESIDGTTVTITRTSSSGEVSIDDISVAMVADDDYYVLEGQKLSENAELDESELLFTENWDIVFSSVEVSSGEDLSLTWSESDEQAILTFEVEDGTVALDLVFGSSGSLLLGEDSDDTLVLNASAGITDNDIFFLATEDTTTAGSDAETFVLQYRGSDASSDDSAKATIRNLATDEDYKRSIASDGSFDLKLGGVTFNFVNSSSSLADDYNFTLAAADEFIYTDDTLVATNGSVYVELRTVGGHLLTIGHNNTLGYLDIALEVDDTDLFDDSGDAGVVVFNASITDSTSDTGDELSISAGDTATSRISDPDDSDIVYSRSDYGELLTVTSPDSSPDKFELFVPSSQVQVMMYVTSGSTTSTTTSDGELMQVKVVDATKLDSEISDVTAQNLIVVGGPCVNSVAAELLGNPSDCAEGFTAGEARVKMFDNGDNVAMLVAGYSGEDTRLAGKVVANRASELSGEEVVIEGSSYSDATISAPSEEAEEEEESAEEETTEE